MLVRGVRRGTHCAPAALRSNNHGESVDEAGVSCGTPATLRPARLRRIQKGWGANNRVAFLLGTFLCFAKETYPKKGDPVVWTPSLRCGATWGARARVRRGTHCAPAALRSNNHGESVDEAGVSCGTPATPRPARLRRIQKGWGANNRVAFLLGTFLCFAKETYPKESRTLLLTPSLRCGATWGARARGAPWNFTARLRRPFKQPRRVS